MSRITEYGKTTYHASGTTTNDDHILPAVFAILEEAVGRHCGCCYGEMVEEGCASKSLLTVSQAKVGSKTWRGVVCDDDVGMKGPFPEAVSSTVSGWIVHIDV